MIGIMKKISSIIILFLPLLASAQTLESTDTISGHTLDEIVVEGMDHSTSATATTFIPSSKQKNAAQNAVDLLSIMGIPQIRVNPMDNSVKDNAGGEVSIFINFMPASQEEMQGLRTSEVRKVEYLEFPTDPRFRGAPRVINIIVQEYEYGGYTKISVAENFLIGLSSTANIYSKFSYKKMTYDLYVGAGNTKSSHVFSNTESTYTLKDAEGNSFSLVRKENTENSQFKQNFYPVTLRASFNTEKIQIRNTLGYSHSGNPLNFQSGNLLFTPSLAQSSTYERTNTSRSNSVNYEGMFYFALPRDFSINVTPTFTFSHNNNTLNYITSASERIIRDARENAYSYRIDAYANKRFGQKHTVMLGVNGGNYINRLNYSGNYAYSDRFHNAFAAALACYQLQTQKINLYTDIGFCWEQSDINGIENTDPYPFLHVNFRYSPNSKNALSAYFQYANNTPGIDAKASDILQENEFMYLTGNPLLKNSRHITVNLSYTWMPSNKLDLSAYCNFFELFNRQMTVYEPFGNGNALIRNYINNGDFLQGQIGITAFWKTLNNNLQLYGGGEMRFFRSTGIYNRSYNPFKFYAQASYYLNSFYFMTFYQTADRSMFSNNPRLYKSRPSYGVAAGWGNSNWNVRLTAFNPFNRKWESADLWISSPLYSEHRTNYGTTAHVRLALSATYSFGYGKKVQRGDEVGAKSGANSAIIKN